MKERQDGKIGASLEKLVRAGFKFDINERGGGACADWILAVNADYESWEKGVNKEVTVIAPDNSYDTFPWLEFSFSPSAGGLGLKDLTHHSPQGYTRIELIDGSGYVVFEKYPKKDYYPSASHFLAGIRRKLGRGSLFNTIFLNKT
jgi:hypothetical protein